MGDVQSAVLVWRDRALFMGDRSQTNLHKHHAVEASVTLSGAMKVRSDGGEWSTCHGAVVASDVAHQIDIAANKVAILYIEPLAADGMALAERAGDRPLVLPDDSHAPLEEAFRALLAAPTLEGGWRTTQSLLAAYGVEASDPPEIDERISRALDFMGRALDDTIRVADVAKHVALSESRFAHLFREQVGMSVSRYVAWLRLRVALTTALGGATMTDAAHAAGFADAAHFTRTCQRGFGLAPTAFAPVDVLLVESGLGAGALPG